MKNQYFGDINDYRKYGLLRVLQASDNKSRILVAWMLTPDDGGPDGCMRSYLKNPGTWVNYDHELFDGLNRLLGSAPQPAVSLLECSQLLPRALYHSELVPDDRQGREAWRASLLQVASGVDLVFLDPDNGIEVPSKPIGRKGSSKYVAWAEIEGLWNSNSGSSILIYQHFRREPRGQFAKRIASELQKRTGAVYTEAIRTSHVLFLLVAQEWHERWLREAMSLLMKRWNGQIIPMGLANSRL